MAVFVTPKVELIVAAPVTPNVSLIVVAPVTFNVLLNVVAPTTARVELMLAVPPTVRLSFNEISPLDTFIVPLNKELPETSKYAPGTELLG